MAREIGNGETVADERARLTRPGEPDRSERGTRAYTGSTKRTAVLLDPCPLWLEAIEHVLEGLDIRVVGTTAERDVAVSLIMVCRPDLFIAEPLSAAGWIDGLAYIHDAKAQAPWLTTIVLSSHNDYTDIEATLDDGADAYVLKTAHPDDLASAVRQAFNPTLYFPSPSSWSVSNGHLSSGLDPRPLPQSSGGPLRAEGRGTHAVLTQREVQILELAAEGHSNAELARMLWISEQTVKFHLSNLYKKIGVSNRTEAGRWAQVHGFLTVQERLLDGVPSRPRQLEGEHRGAGVSEGLAERVASQPALLATTSKDDQ